MMRNQIILMASFFLALPCTAVFAIELGDEDRWSLEDGLLGDSIEGDVFTDDGTVYPGWLCDDCRDPDDYAIDFAAVAYNGFWGENPWMRESRLGIPFRIYNLNGEWVALWFENLLFDSITLLPDTLDIRIRLQTGQIVTITVLQNGPDMPIGDTAPEPTTSSAGGAGGGGDEDGEDYAEIDDYEWEEPEYSGSVEIIDPDDDGEFPEWQEEL